MPTQPGLGASASRLARPITAPGDQRRLPAARPALERRLEIKA